MEPKARKVLCLEHVSLLRYRAVRRYLRQVDTVAIFEPYGTREEHLIDPHEVDRAVARWGQALEGVTVRRLTHREYLTEMFEAGEETVQFLEAEGDALLKQTAVYDRLHRLLQSEAVMLALKKGLVPYIKDRVNFCKVVMRLAGEPGTHIILAPASHDAFSILPRWLGALGDRITIPTDLEHIGRWRDRHHQLRYLLYALAGVPVRLTHWVFQSLTLLTWKRITPQSVDWARMIAGAFRDGQNSAGHAHRTDDDLEDDADFPPSGFLYIHGMWRFPDEKIKQWQKMLRARGAQFVDMWRLRMPVPFYLRVKLPASWQRFLWCLESLGVPGLSRLCEAGHTITEAYVEAHLFMQYYRPKVYDVRDEYLVGHIVRTIVFNQYGCKTIGIHHGAYASLGLNPHLAYTYCNVYCAYGPAYLNRIWIGTWSYSPRLAAIGVERNDYTYRACQNEARRREFGRKYAGAKVLLWCPNAASPLNRLELLEETLKALADFLATHREWVIILHCRKAQQAWFSDFISRMGENERMVTEAQFSTYEFIAYVDAIVATNVSTVGIEAICAGRERVVFVNHWGGKNPFLVYSSGLVVSSGGALSAQLNRWACGEQGQSRAALEAFRRDFDVGFDGMALERYKDEMRKLAGLNPVAPAVMAMPEVPGEMDVMAEKSEALK